MAANPEKLKKTKEIGRKDILFRLAIQEGSSRAFIGSSDFKVYDLDVLAEKPEPKELAGHESYVMGVVLAGKHLVTGGWDRRLIWWNAESGEQVNSVDGHDRWVRNLAVTPDGKTVASVADDMVCKLWDAESGKLIRELKGHDAKTPHHYPSMLYAVAVSPDGKLLATGDRTGKTVVWNLADGKQLATLETPVMYTWDPRQRRHSIGGIRSLAFSHDGKQLAVGGMGKVGNIDHLGGKARVEVFQWEKGEKTHELESDPYKGLVEQLRFSPEGNWLLAAGGDHNGFLWFIDLETKKPLKEEKAPMHVHDVAFDASYETLYGVGHGKIAVWELKG